MSTEDQTPDDGLERASAALDNTIKKAFRDRRREEARFRAPVETSEDRGHCGNDHPDIAGEEDDQRERQERYESAIHAAKAPNGKWTSAAAALDAITVADTEFAPIREECHALYQSNCTLVDEGARLRAELKRLKDDWQRSTETCDLDLWEKVRSAEAAFAAVHALLALFQDNPSSASELADSIRGVIPTPV